MNVLIVAPIPILPVVHGNRARQKALVEAIRSMGHSVTYLYGARESISLADEEAMRDLVDDFYVYEPLSPVWDNLSAPPYQIDDWWLEGMDKLVSHILSRRTYDVAIASYVWFSSFLQHLPDTVLKLIDTHDVFANRHEALEAIGIGSHFFSASQDEEDKGLSRADRIIAIQDSEQQIFKQRGFSAVDVIGHLLSPKFLDNPAPSGDRPLRAGFFGSGNPLNQHAVKLLKSAIESFGSVERERAVEWYLVGTITKTPAAIDWPGTMINFVDSPQDFYESVDIAVNPHIGGTGLKIKSVEALSYGIPLLGTKDAMLGFNVSHEWHDLDTAQELVSAVYAMAADKKVFSNFRDVCRSLYQSYYDEQLKNLQRVFSS